MIKNNLTVGRKVSSRISLGSKVTITKYDDGEICGFDIPRSSDAIVVYRSKKSTGTNSYGVEAIVNNERIITSIEIGKGNAAVPNGGFVISGHGKGAEWIEQNLKVGARITSNISVGCAVTYEYPEQ